MIARLFQSIFPSCSLRMPRDYAAWMPPIIPPMHHHMAFLVVTFFFPLPYARAKIFRILATF